jgi:uncharacterized protein
MKRIFALAFAGFVALATLPLAHADEEIPHACVGRNLMTELAASDPAAAAEVEKAMRATPNQGPLLWKIEPPNKAKPSYLLGTAHVTDTRVATPSEDVKAKIAASSVLLEELQELGNKQNMVEKVKRDADRFMMPKGQSVWDLIPDDREAAIRRNPMLAMIPPTKLAEFKPIIMSMTAATPFCEVLRKPFKPVLDEALAKHALASNVKVIGLETMNEQLDVLTSMTLEEQTQMLLDQFALDIPAEDSFQTLVELYLARKVSAMRPLMEYYAKKKGITITKGQNDFEYRLLDKRNKIMAKRAAPYFKKGNAFMAVGALHLAGEKGVIALLRKAGFKVTPAE